MSKKKMRVIRIERRLCGTGAGEHAHSRIYLFCRWWHPSAVAEEGWVELERAVEPPCEVSVGDEIPRVILTGAWALPGRVVSLPDRIVMP